MSLTLDQLERCVKPTPSGRVVLALIAAGAPLTAKNLMIRAGMDLHRNPVSAFASLCAKLPKINATLAQSGWIVVRSGGTPDDHYHLTQLAEGTVLEKQGPAALGHNQPAPAPAGSGQTGRQGEVRG